MNIKHKYDKINKGLNSKRPLIQLFDCVDTHATFIGKLHMKIKQVNDDVIRYDLLVLLSMLSNSQKMYEGVVSEISTLVNKMTGVIKIKDSYNNFNISNVLVILNQIDNEEMRTIM